MIKGNTDRMEERRGFFLSALPAGVPTWGLIEGLTGGGVG